VLAVVTRPTNPPAPSAMLPHQQRAAVTLGKAGNVAFAQPRIRRAERAVSMVITVFWHVTPWSLLVIEMEVIQSV